MSNTAGRAAPLRLFCFPHAGGGSWAFSGWNRALGPAVDVVPIEIPNRERFATLRDLVTEVNEQFGSAMSDPHVFFGHSFGALLAYRLACARAAENSPLPRVLCVSSFAPPHLPPPLSMVDHLSDDQLLTLMSNIGGIPANLDQWPALRDQAISAARNDLRLCMTDQDAQEPPLPCPIHAFGGSDDPFLDESDLHEWRPRTSADFSVTILPGDHFYFRDRHRLFAGLRPLMSTSARR